MILHITPEIFNIYLIVMATVALLITATLIAVGMGFLFDNLFQSQSWMGTSYDMYIGTSHMESDFTRYKEVLYDNVSVRDDHEYYVYGTGEDVIMRYLQSKKKDIHMIYDTDFSMRMSDYAALRRMLGYSEVTLEKGDYLIHCVDYMEDWMNDYHETLRLGNQTLKPGGVYTESFTQERTILYPGGSG